MGDRFGRGGSLALAAMLLASLGLAGCQDGGPSRSPGIAGSSLPPDVAACQGSDADAPPMPTLPAVAGIDHGQTGVLLLAAPVPNAADLVYLVVCRYERGSSLRATDSTGGSLNAGFDGPLSLDRGVKVDGPPQEYVLGGRVSDEVTAVEVVLEDGSSEDAVIRDGYWIAWWSGPTAPSVVRALDTDGNEVATADPTGQS